MKFYPLLLDDREREALHRTLHRSKDEMLLGIRDKLVTIKTGIKSQPMQAEMDRLTAAMARLIRRIG